MGGWVGGWVGDKGKKGENEDLLVLEVFASVCLQEAKFEGEGGLGDCVVRWVGGWVGA